MKKSLTRRLECLLASTVLLVAVGKAQTARDDPSGSWLSAGGDAINSRSQPDERRISTANVSSLKTKWVFTAGGDISATPTVAGNAVYVPDWAGELFAVRRNDGSVLWSHMIADYDGFTGAYTRVSPAIHGADLIIGDIQSGTAVHKGANVIAIDRATGVRRWITQVDDHPAAIVTGSPLVFDDVVYVGVSSNEEALADQPNYPCCSFRGSMVALNANTGAIIWKTFTLPENGGQTGGYSGNAIWQPPAIDAARGTLYVGTGNNYSVPAEVEACQAKAIADNDPNANCTPVNDYFDTALALDLKTGAIKWAKRLYGFDVWTVACIQPKAGVTCPSPSGPDYDLSGSGPNLLRNIVGFSQKSGIYWALNPDTGEIVWSTVVGPGSTLGGIEWGTATDGERIYVAITNGQRLSHTLIGGQTINWGSWSALDAATGKILWQTADPTPGAFDMGAVSVANGVVYAGSFAGQMYGLDAKAGRVLWSFDSGGSVLDGPSIVDGVIYWGSGYKKIQPGIGNNKLYAFTVATRLRR
jgi:polyvinyl alcohol dehydrogenase (cytochrome)